MNDDFSRLVLEAAADNSKWTDVLKSVVRLCGATKGVITLRDLKSAQLHFPDEALVELTSPLIVNFAPEFAESYFGHYADCDVWTPIERRYYPYSPYFMSDHLSFDALCRTEFWQWLEPQGIVDCLVAEIYSSRWHWVALNLHFDAAIESRRDEVLATLRAILPTVRTGWGVSERIIELRRAKVASESYLESWPYPTIILDEDIVVTSVNKLALQELSKHVGLSSNIAIGTGLAVRPCALRDTLNRLKDHPPAAGSSDALCSVPSDSSGYVLQISTIAQATDAIGKRRAHFLVLAKPVQSPRALTKDTLRIWETKGLTKMQSEIVKWIAEGGIVPEFAVRNNITKKTAYDHLFAARQKLDGLSSRDIYTTHQALLKMEHM